MERREKGFIVVLALLIISLGIYYTGQTDAITELTQSVIKQTQKGITMAFSNIFWMAMSLMFLFIIINVAKRIMGAKEESD